MSEDAKPYSLGRTIAVGLGIAAAFALLSLFFLYMQAQNAYHRLAGEVVAVAGDSLDIRNARGAITVLTVQPQTELRGVADIALLEIGQHVMTRGSFADDGTFVVDRLRVIRGPDRP
ncbi:hypothetical protein KUH32_17240 [Thalassococcus sp. CAU 1522]|uniref:Uncharacterized protein n=1 Tax=Thalassococcus arenae TaxID=2851652 RepID=A0ABS6NBV9_9RHOB|nr:hypothetical protein [Thalassococcus arenae]MBV2361511.1 hypothetical protein [Thalassococcus arenae]